MAQAVATAALPPGMVVGSVSDVLTTPDGEKIARTDAAASAGAQCEPSVNSHGNGTVCEPGRRTGCRMSGALRMGSQN